jgi:hypothetical protein
VAIKQIEKPPQRRKFVVYDLEWYPKSMELRMVGLYDGDRYRHFRDVGSFLRHVLTDDYLGTWMFAHWGGAADIAFFLRYLYKRNYVVDLRFSGSSAVFCEVRKGKKKWIFVDSFFLLRAKLADIMTKMGMAKGGQESDEEHWAILNGPFDQLVDYNENDCVGLYTALDRFQETLLGMGGEMMPTIAATAMRLFRRVYLQGDIHTDAENNHLARQAYIASRVEVFSKWSEDCYQYDINSSFPSSMTLPAPGEYLGRRAAPPEEHDLFLVKARVTALPMGVASYFPPLPYRHAGKIWFPLGTWDGWFTGADFRIMEEMGRIEKVEEVREFSPCWDMRRYVEDIYARRKATLDPYEREIWKLLMNALYGKWAERTEKDTIILNSSKDPGYYLAHGATSAEEIFGGAIVLTTQRAIAHEHVPFSAHITSHSRAKILRLLLAAGDVKYTDTDSLTTPAILPTGNELGELKLEKKVKRGHYRAPKLYSTEDEGGEVKIKAKGFSKVYDEELGRGRKLTEADFQSLCEGGFVMQERMRRPKEMIRKVQADRDEGVEALMPQLLQIKKMLQNPVEKRLFSEDGRYSRPYTITEIHDAHPS